MLSLLPARSLVVDGEGGEPPRGDLHRLLLHLLHDPGLARLPLLLLAPLLALAPPRPPPSFRPVAPKRGVSLVVTAKETIDRTTGFIGKDNSGSGNIFAVEPRQLYTESPTSDKYAKRGLGGIPGVILACGILAGVYFATQTLGSFEEANQEFVNYNGQSVSYYIDLFSQ